LVDVHFQLVDYCRWEFCQQNGLHFGGDGFW
jgi:hypothetical protein